MKWINTIEDYEIAVSQGFEPLIDWRHFAIPIRLRIDLQHSIFGTGNNPQVNERFYRWVWQRKTHVCEERMKPLDWYSAVHISHILTKGAHPDIAHDPRNTNILSTEAHQQWETGNREIMRIYEENQLVIKMLKDDYKIKD